MLKINLFSVSVSKQMLSWSRIFTDINVTVWRKDEYNSVEDSYGLRHFQIVLVAIELNARPVEKQLHY